MLRARVVGRPIEVDDLGSSSRCRGVSRQLGRIRLEVEGRQSGHPAEGLWIPESHLERCIATKTTTEAHPRCRVLAGPVGGVDERHHPRDQIGQVGLTLIDRVAGTAGRFDEHRYEGRELILQTVENVGQLPELESIGTTVHIKHGVGPALRRIGGRQINVDRSFCRLGIFGVGQLMLLDLAPGFRLASETCRELVVGNTDPRPGLRFGTARRSGSHLLPRIARVGHDFVEVAHEAVGHPRPGFELFRIVEEVGAGNPGQGRLDPLANHVAQDSDVLRVAAVKEMHPVAFNQGPSLFAGEKLVRRLFGVGGFAHVGQETPKGRIGRERRRPGRHPVFAVDQPHGRDFFHAAGINEAAGKTRRGPGMVGKKRQGRHFGISRRAGRGQVQRALLVLDDQFAIEQQKETVARRPRTPDLGTVFGFDAGEEAADITVKMALVVDRAAVGAAERFAFPDFFGLEVVPFAADAEQHGGIGFGGEQHAVAGDHQRHRTFRALAGGIALVGDLPKHGPGLIVESVDLGCPGDQHLPASAELDQGGGLVTGKVVAGLKDPRAVSQGKSLSELFFRDGMVDQEMFAQQHR